MIFKKSLKNFKIALVVEELTQLGGAERLLDYYLEMFPNVPVFTLIWDKEKTLHRYDKFDIQPSFIQKLPFGVKRYKWYLALMPKAVESFDLKNFEIVLSITSALVKGVKTTSKQLHICYCNTPTRWLWTDSKNYLLSAPIPFFAKPLMPTIINMLKKWDFKAARRPDYFIANSENVQKRIKKYYHRDSLPIFVPVDVNKFKISKNPGRLKTGYFLVVSRLEPYKKVELVIEAFKRLNLPLKIVGSGTKFENLKKSVPKNIELIGRVSDEKLAEIYQNSIATIFPQEEDAGIVPLESMACGRPVIAYGKGGVIETVIDGKTGILFQKQTVNDLIKAIKRFQKLKFNPRLIRAHAQEFDKELFKEKILEYINNKLQITNSKAQTNSKS